MTVPCFNCDIRFDDEGWRSCCEDCWEKLRIDHDDQQKELFYLLKKLRNFPYSEEDKKLVADSAVFPYFVSEIFQHMKAQQAVNLLKKVKG